MSSAILVWSRPISAEGRKGSMPALVLEDLVAGYGGAPVIDGMSLTVGDSERVGLFGPNGHGKTTLLRTISGLIAPTHGSMKLFGREIVGLAPAAIVAE